MLQSLTINTSVNIIKHFSKEKGGICTEEKVFLFVNLCVSLVLYVCVGYKTIIKTAELRAPNYFIKGGLRFKIFLTLPAKSKSQIKLLPPTSQILSCPKILLR